MEQILLKAVYLVENLQNMVYQNAVAFVLVAFIGLITLLGPDPK